MRRSPLKPGKPLARGKTRLRSSKRLSRNRRLKARRFRERFPTGKDGPRYGLAWQLLDKRAKAGHCWVAERGYVGPGHPKCGTGSRGLRPTACHIGRTDADGAIEGCGRAHDLIDGYGSRSTRKAWEAWLGETDLAAVGRSRIAWAEKVLDTA